MGNDPRAPGDTKTGAKGAVADEDEDLFDFPVIEMLLEVEGLPENLTVGQVVGAPAASAAPTPASPPIADAAPFAPIVAPCEAARASSPAKPSTRTTAPSASKPESSSPASPAAKGDVRLAAELIEGLERVLDDTLDTSSTPRRRRNGPARVTATGGSPLALLGGMLLLNILTFAFFWYVSQSFRDGMEVLRNDLLLVSKGQTSMESVQAAPVGTAQAAPVAEPVHVAATEHESVVQESAPPEQASALAVEPKSGAPAIAFEETTLGLAAQEIRAGEVLSARKRLSRLLAMVDRVDPLLRADVEARARYMLADSYAEQAALRTRELGAHSNGAPHSDDASVRGPVTRSGAAPRPAGTPVKGEGH